MTTRILVSETLGNITEGLNSALRLVDAARTTGSQAEMLDALIEARRVSLACSTELLRLLGAITRVAEQIKKDMET